MTISRKIQTMMERSSWIRKMFTEGAQLKSVHGAENVFDFSLGNPNVPPPEEFHQTLMDTVKADGKDDHAYMPNTGYPAVCEAIAGYLSSEQQVEMAPTDVIMTCGAAGALNVSLKAILDPGDVVLCPAPYFVEYNSYVDNHGGTLKTVPTLADFSLDFSALEASLTPEVKAVLINSPNNPTGKIYSEDDIRKLGQLLEAAGSRVGHAIYLISDEPYRKIVFDDAVVPSIFTHYRNSILCTSYSKDISIPGERIGFAAINPNSPSREDLINGMAMTNRILGYVNAPALMQRVVARMQGKCVDIGEYARKRDLLCDGLADFGYEFNRPEGTFYLFPKSPVPDDVEFVKVLQEELILVVPGSGFGGPGHFRIAFCVEDDTIVNAMPGFRRAMERYK